MKRRSLKVVAAVALAIGLTGGIAYYMTRPCCPVSDFVSQRDRKEMLKIFYDDWYWLFPGSDYSPEYILDTKSPGKEAYQAQYRGKLQIKVLRKDGKLAGFTTYYKKNFYEGQIQFVAVSPAFRRKGYGQMLTVCAVKGLFAMGCKKASLLTRLNNEKARRIYERLGFKETSRDDDGFIYYSVTPKDFKG